MSDDMLVFLTSLTAIGMYFLGVLVGMDYQKGQDASNNRKVGDP